MLLLNPIEDIDAKIWHLKIDFYNKGDLSQVFSIIYQLCTSFFDWVSDNESKLYDTVCRTGFYRVCQDFSIDIWKWKSLIADLNSKIDKIY